MITHPLSQSSAIWICVSVSVSSSGTQSVTQFAPGFMMIDYLSSLFLLMKTEDQWQSLNYILLYIKEQGLAIRFLPYRCVMYLPIKALYTLLSTLKVLQPFLSHHCKCDTTWQIHLIFKSTYCQIASDLGAGGKDSAEIQRCFLNNTFWSLSGLSGLWKWKSGWIRLLYGRCTCGSSSSFCTEWCNAAELHPNLQGFLSVKEVKRHGKGRKWRKDGKKNRVKAKNCTCRGSE